jgi:hypothetical protein
MLVTFRLVFSGRLWLHIIALTMLMMPLQGKEWASQEARVSFEIPENSSWQKLKSPKPEIKLILQSKDKGSTILFFVIPAPPDEEVLNEKFVKGFEKGVYKTKGASKRSGEFLNYKGKQAYKALGDLDTNNVSFKTARILWIERGMVFQISVMKRGEDPLKDEVINAFIESMKVATHP